MKKFNLKKSVLACILVLVLTMSAGAGVASAKTIKNYFGTGTKLEYGLTFWGNPYAKSYTNAGGHYAKVQTSTGNSAIKKAPAGWTKDAKCSAGTWGTFRYWADAGFCNY